MKESLQSVVLGLEDQDDQVTLVIVQSKGPSIYDVHTEGGQAQVDACGRGRESSPMWTSPQKIKIRVH